MDSEKSQGPDTNGSIGARPKMRLEPITSGLSGPQVNINPAPVIADEAPTATGAPWDSPPPADKPYPNPGRADAPWSENHSSEPEDTAADTTAPPPDAVYSPPYTNYRPRAYLVEYLLSLIITGTLLGVAISFFNGIVKSIGSSGSGGGWTAQFAYTGSLVTLSVALVFIPALVYFSRHCRSAEDQSPDIRLNRWRKGFLGIFLVLVSLFALGSAVSFVYGLVSWLASFGVTDRSTGEILSGLGVNAFSLLLLGSTAVLYARDYRGGFLPEVYAKAHRYGLVLTVLVLMVFFTFMPLRKQRNSFIDGIKSRDISALKSSVDSFAADENRLPERLDQLMLKEDIKRRLGKYEYIPTTDKFELCAEFKTDTRSETSSGNPLEDVLYGSYSSGLDNTPDPDRHDKGRVCFEYASRAVPTTYDPSYYQDLLDNPRSDQ